MSTVQLNSDLIYVKTRIKTFVVDNSTIPANRTKAIVFSNTKRTDGYSRIMMVCSLENATTSGSGSSFCTIYNQQVVSVDNDLNTVIIVKNFSTSEAKIKATCRLMYSFDNGMGKFD